MIAYLCRHVIFYQDSQKESKKLKDEDVEKNESAPTVEKEKTPENKRKSKAFNINQTLDQDTSLLDSGSD